MASTRPCCAVVGAANIDIGGFPEGVMAMRDSNPGRIRMSSGGVGRNIACNLARLGIQTQLVAALGGDAFADVIRADCASAGVQLDHAFAFKDAASSSYLFIADEGGDMQLAVNDMGICARVTPQALEGKIDALNGMSAVVIDANLPDSSILWLSKNVRAPLIADAVSAAKARRLLPALGGLCALKANAIEAAALTGLPVHDRASAEATARRLVDMGVKRAFITMGERGVCCADARETLYLPGPAVRMKNTTGAGDAFTAALAWMATTSPESDLREWLAAGLGAASIAIEAEPTVSPVMSAELLAARVRRIRKQTPGQ